MGYLSLGRLKNVLEKVSLFTTMVKRGRSMVCRLLCGIDDRYFPQVAFFRFFFGDCGGRVFGIAFIMTIEQQFFAFAIGRGAFGAELAFPIAGQLAVLKDKKA